MTPKERLLAACRRQPTDVVPCNLYGIRWIRQHERCVCPRHQLAWGERFGLDLIIPYGSYTWRSVTNDYIYAPGGGQAFSADGCYGDLPDVAVKLSVRQEREGVRYERTFETPAGVLHDVILWPRPGTGYGDGPNPHRITPLVKTIADAEALRFLYPAPREDVLADIAPTLQETGERALVAALDGVGPGSWGMESLGPELMLTASVDNPDLLQAVCRTAQDAHRRNLAAMLERGLPVVFDSWFQCGPSVGWSPATYETIFLPMIRECVDLAHQYGALYIYQDDGNMRAILPHIVAADADVIAGLQPPPVGDVNLKEARAAYGDKVAFMGGLDPCYTFDRGAPSAVQTAVREALEAAGSAPGFILCTAESVDPATPIECLDAYVASARLH